jgi:large subunit ribosomal protein L29
MAKRIDTADLTSEELGKKVTELKDQLFHLRFKLATGQLENHHQLKATRRDIARCLGPLARRLEAESKDAGAAA